MQEKKTKEKGNGRVRCMLVAFFFTSLTSCFGVCYLGNLLCNGWPRHFVHLWKNKQNCQSLYMCSNQRF